MATSRNSNFNPQPVAVKNGAKDEIQDPETRRSPISAFAADGQGGFTRYNADGTQDVVTPAQQMFQQMGQMIQSGNDSRAQKRQMDDAALASALVYSKQNGGFLPTDILEAMSQQLGMPIAGGNFTSDGNYVLYGRQQYASQNGKVRGERFVPIAIADPQMQFQVLQRSGLGQSMAQGLYNDFSKKLTPQQLADKGIFDPALATANNTKKSDEKAKNILNDISAMQKYMADNSATMDDDTRTNMTTAIGNAMKTLAERYLPKASPTGAGSTEPPPQQGPQVSEDGFTMKLMDGRTIRKDQEFEVEGPNGQKMKLIWRGSDAKNVEKIN